MKFFNGLRVYGDVNFRGECPKEDAELMTFFSNARNYHPQKAMLSKVLFHVENEGKRTDGKRSKAKGGLVKGVSDICAIGSPMLLIEMKRKDHTKSVYQSGQEELLKIAHQAGCFACIALGYEGALQAVDEWLKLDPFNMNK